MDETIYAQKRKNLTDAYERQRAQNERQWAEQQAEYDAQRSRLAEDRERAKRDVYVRQQQKEAQLPDELNRLGISGGAAESNLLRIKTAYDAENGQIEQAYQSAARQVDQMASAQYAKQEANRIEAENEYYAQLTELAEELAEAQQARAEAERAQQQQQAEREQERRWEREKLQLQLNAALQKAQIQADLAREKAQIQANSKVISAETGSNRTDWTGTAKTASAAAQSDSKVSGASEKGVQYLTVQTAAGPQRLTKVNGRLYANPISFRADGQMRISVGDQKFSMAELTKALKDGTVTAAAGPMNSSRYILTSGSEAGSGMLSRIRR